MPKWITNFERKFIDVHPLQCLGPLKEEHHEDDLECPHHRLYSGDGLLSKTFSGPMDGMCAVLTSPMDGILRRQLTDVPSMNYKILNARLQLVCAPMQEVVNSPELEPPHPGSDRGLGS